MVALSLSATELESRARSGDGRAFGELIRRFDSDLRGVAWSVVRTADGTDDVMQTAYEKAFRSIESFDGRSALKTWLHSIVHRTALDYLRYEGRRRHQTLAVVDQIGLGLQTDGASDRALGRLELSALLDHLEPESRAALMLTVGLGYSYEEAAEILGEARGTVASRVSRARKQLAHGGKP